MSRNYWENNLYPQFLESVDSCTFSEISNYDLQNQIGLLAIRAIADFKFPKYSLAYAYDSTINPATQLEYGYYFTEPDGDALTQKEYNVILSRMKYYWIEFQVSQEKMFDNAYYDRDIRLHSPGNTLDKLIKMAVTFKSFADDAERDYGRVDVDGTPTWGNINE